MSNLSNAIAVVSRAFALCAAISFVHVSTAWAQPSSVEIEQARRDLGSTEFAQEYKMDDIFLVKNNDQLSVCVKNAAEMTSEMLTCISESVEKLDGYLLRLITRKKLNEKASEIFFKSRKYSCIKISDDFDGTNQAVVYADCLRIRTVEEIIKKSHSVGNIDEFLFLLIAQQKISVAEQEDFFKSRKSFCTDAAKFWSDSLEKTLQAEDVYRNCINTRAIEEVLKKLR
jgi:hypothetical protein